MSLLSDAPNQNHNWSTDEVGKVSEKEWMGEGRIDSFKSFCSYKSAPFQAYNLKTFVKEPVHPYTLPVTCHYIVKETPSLPFSWEAPLKLKDMRLQINQPQSKHHIIRRTLSIRRTMSYNLYLCRHICWIPLGTAPSQGHSIPPPIFVHILSRQGADTCIILIIIG